MTLTRSHRIGVVVACVSLAAATLAVVHDAAAQGGAAGQRAPRGGFPQGGPQGQAPGDDFGPVGGGAFGGPGGPGGQGGPGGFGPQGMMPGRPGSMLAANSTRVFVLRGNTLLAFDANSLRLVSQTQLPQPTGPVGPEGPGAGFGPAGRGGARPPQGNEDPR